MMKKLFRKPAGISSSGGNREQARGDAGSVESSSSLRSSTATAPPSSVAAPLRSSASSASAMKPNGVGATSVEPGHAVFRVNIPDGVQPGQEFQVYAGSRIVRVRCPAGSISGQSLQITVPIDPSMCGPNMYGPGNVGGNAAVPNPNMPPDSPNVERIDDQAYMVTIPEGVRGGQQFPVRIAGQELMVTAPLNARVGTRVRVVPPRDITEAPSPPMRQSSSYSTASSTSPSAHAGGLGDSGGSSTLNGGGASSSVTPPGLSSQQSFASHSSSPPPPSMPNQPQHQPRPRKEKDPTQLFEVEVPMGVQPGQPFALLAGGVRVLVTCPVNAGPGQRIRFKLPLALTQKPKPQNEAAAIKLSYDKDGWTRTIRVSDMKFQWVRMDDKGDVETNTRFDADKSAYVRLLTFRPGSDPRTRDGVLSLVPANEAFVDSSIDDIVSYADIAEAQVKGFEDKCGWFQNRCHLLAVEWNEGHMRINVRRDFLLEDSVDAVMSLSRRDLRKLWRFEFIGEMGIDAGGLAREWFQLVTQEIFDPDMGLWQSSEANQMCMQINPASKFFGDDFLVYYRFLGRVMGKALFDRQLVAGHMVPYVYKHMLGWPITFRDIEGIDEEYYTNLKQLQQLDSNGEDLSMLMLDFTVNQEIMGVKEQVDLIENGADTEVTNENFPEYLEACLKYRMMMAVKPQLTELLLGFFDVIPEPLLTVFDFQELELLMCGLPVIDLEDWKEHTEYSGDYEMVGADNPTCQWFWAVVEEFDQEMKARLLQFVTGTSGVPSRGFGVLQGNDGNIRKFTIHGVPVHTCLYPRAHTCFNRIDLPVYETMEELRDRLKLAVTMVATGFDIE